MAELNELARRASRFFAERVEPLVFARRRRHRLRAFGIDSLDDTAWIAFELLQPGCRQTAHCAAMVRRYAGYYGRFFAYAAPANAAAGILAVLPLQHYATAVEFQRALRQRSAGFFQAAAKARKAGYTTALFQPQNHAPDIWEIRRSKRWRAFGPVLDAFTLTLDDLGGAPDHLWPLTPPACPQHWQRHFGVFHEEQGHRQGAITVDRRLVAYAHLHRIGNVVRYAEFIGHGDYQSSGVMAFLHLNVVTWLRLAEDSFSSGVDFLTYGAIEQGREGLAFWKRKALFIPARIVPAGSVPAGSLPVPTR